MKEGKSTPQSVDEYVASFPKGVQAILKEVRKTIRKAVPEAEEAIKYQIPTFALKGSNLVHFAAYEHHIGFYPAPRGADEFKEELSAYEGGKGTVKFPLDEPISYDLIKRMVEYRVRALAKSAPAQKAHVKRAPTPKAQAKRKKR